MTRGKKKEKILTPEEKLQEALVPESEQPYRLPDNWRWTTLGKLFVVKGGKRLPKGQHLLDEKTDHPYLRVTDFSNLGIDDSEMKYIDESTFSLIKNYTISAKDIYISIAGSIGKVGIIPEYLEGANLTENAAKITNIRVIEQKYLLWYLTSYGAQNQMKESTISTTQPKLAIFRIEEILIPIPPLPEQQRIVNCIENLFAKLDEAKDKAQAVVDGFEDRKAAILHKAFTGELTCCKSDIHTVYITDVIKNEKNALKAGPFGSALRKDMYVSSGYKIYGQEQVINGDEGIGDYYIDEKKYKELIACKVAPGDVLISLVGTVGKVLVLSKDCKPGIINPRLIKVSLDEDIMLPLYFKYYFESGYLKSLYKSDAHGTTMDVLNMGILKKLPFPLVGIDKQKEIIMTLNILLNNEEQAIESAEQVIAQIDTMKKSILARAFRGELGTSDPSDESAEELLKRIL